MAKQPQYTSPLVVFLLYVAAAFGVICGYRFISPPPSLFIDILGCFKVSWCFSGGIITFIHLFPALAFSGLVIPFGLREHSEGGYAGTTYVGKKGFSAVFLKYLFWPVITASAAAMIYGLLFFLVLPLTMNLKSSVEDRSELYARARTKAEAKAADKEWAEASLFIDICDKIWPESPDIEKLKARVIDSLASYRETAVKGAAEETAPIWAGLPGTPVNAADALKLAEEAFAKEEYYDAHWLATLAERLAAPGAAEVSAAVTLASRAWERIAALEPNALERERYFLYGMKRDAYEAMNAGSWVSAFYTFQDLSILTPNDPDVVKYLELSKNGVAQTAFFIDELDLAVGTTLTEPVFSLPGQNGGRAALHFASLALLRDSAYAWGTEAVAADEEGRFRFQVTSDYAKIIPISARDNEGNPNDRTVLLFQALDRADKTKGIGPVWTSGDAAFDPMIGANQMMLPISFDNFLLLSKVKQGTEILNLRELFTAEKSFEAYGYVRESFRAEIFRRLGETLFFLPLAVLALILGWRYRAMKKPRYVYVPMLVLLPIVFHWAVLFYRNIIANLSVWLSLTLGLTTALIFLAAGAGVFFIVTLILLAAQHG